MFDYSPNSEADNAIKQLAESFALVLPRELGISEFIPGCEVTDMDPEGVGIATIPRAIEVRIDNYTVPAYWRGNPPLDVGSDCLIVHSREGDIYEVITVSGTGSCSTAELLLHHWVYDVSEGVILHFDTIAAALAYGALASGDYILLRPGTFDEAFTMQDGVIITEIVPGSVIINRTSGNVAVTAADGGYLRCKELRCTRGGASDAVALDISGLGVGESCEIRAELIEAVQTGATGGSSIYAIFGGGSGTAYIHADVRNTFTGSGGGIDNDAVVVDGDIVYIYGNINTVFTGTTIGWTHCAMVYSGSLWLYGNAYANGDSYCVAVEDWGGASYVVGDIEAYSAVSGAFASGTYADGGDIIHYGNARGNAAGGGASLGTGAYISSGTSYTHGDVEGSDAGGDSYGAYCDGGTMFVGFGRATGDTTDIYRDSGAMQVSMLDFDSYGGTITQSYPMVDDAWIGDATGAGGKITFDNQATDIFNVVSARFGIDAAAPAAMLHTIQDSATGAIPTIQAKQDDISEPVIYVDSDADNDIEIVELGITGSPKWRWDETLDLFEFTHELRTTTSLYRRYYHLAIESFNPGASGATWVDPDANTVGGYRQTASSHDLLFGADVHPDWDGASDLEVEVYFELGVAGSAPGDVVVLDLEVYYKGTGEAVTKNQSLSDTVTVDASAQYTMFKAEFTIDYDAVGNVVDAGDIFRFVLTLDTANSDVDNVIINHGSFNYQTTHVGIEAGDV